MGAVEEVSQFFDGAQALDATTKEVVALVISDKLSDALDKQRRIFDDEIDQLEDEIREEMDNNVAK